MCAFNLKNELSRARCASKTSKGDDIIEIFGASRFRGCFVFNFLHGEGPNLAIILIVYN